MNNDILLKMTCSGLSLGAGVLFANTEFVWRKGEQWAIVGPNGSGKTVFLSLLSGARYSPGIDVEYGFAGRAGKEPEDLIETISLERLREQLGAFDAYVQMRWNSTEDESSPTLAEWFSIRAVDEIPLYEMRRHTRAQIARFNKTRDTFLRLMRIDRLLTRRLAELSNGEMRRAFLARALMKNPRILILDAPFLGLDAQSHAIVEDTLADLATCGNAVRGKIHTIFATVRPEEIPPYVTHVLELDAHGNIVWQGPRKAHTSVPVDPVAPVDTHRRNPPGDSATRAPLVEMRDISVSYGKTKILRHLDWTVRAGERWLLFGPNGSGKTTLLAMIIGDHPQAYSNDVKIFGMQRGGQGPFGSGESIWDIKKRIGWVSPELHACMDASQTVLHTVLSGFIDTPYDNRRHTKKQTDAARALLESFDLRGVAESPFGALSSGEQRLVLLARALVKQPPLLVLDEPCQNLDAKNRATFLRIVDAICRDPGITLIYVTHQRDTVPRCITHKLRLS